MLRLVVLFQWNELLRASFHVVAERSAVSTSYICSAFQLGCSCCSRWHPHIRAHPSGLVLLSSSLVVLCHAGNSGSGRCWCARTGVHIAGLAGRQTPGKRQWASESSTGTPLSCRIPEKNLFSAGQQSQTDDRSLTPPLTETSVSSRK